jgi:hypothetical protein
MKHPLILRYMLFYAISLSLLATSCNENAEKTGASTKVYYPDTLIEVNESVFRFKILIDRADVDPAAATATFNENTGDYEINCGEDYSLRFSQVTMTIEDFKNQLNSDTPFPVSITDESTNHLIWQALLPDGTLGYYNLFAVKNINGFPMTIRSTEKFDWSEQSIQKMYRSIQGIE